MNIILSDLDGTLLRHDNYSYQDASNALEAIKRKNIPLVFCTSKTRAEIDYYRKKIGNTHPFISENGGAIFIPKNYFSLSFLYQKTTNRFLVIELGTAYETLVKHIKILQQTFDIQSFEDMTIEEVAEETDLETEKAALAKKRDYSIPFKILNENEKEAIFKDIKKQNLHVTKGGRFYHLMGDNDKGEAAKILLYIYQKEFKTIRSIGIGDSENDFPMLDVVNHPYLVMKPDRTFASTRYNHANGIGPVGWKMVIERELKL